MFDDFYWKATNPEFENHWKEIFRTRKIPTRSILNQSKYLDSAGQKVCQISDNIFADRHFVPEVQNFLDIKATINGQSANNLVLECKNHAKTGAYPFFDIGYDFLLNCYEKKQNVAVLLDRTTRPVLTAFLMRFCSITFTEASRHLMVCLKNFELSRNDIIQLQYYQYELSIV